MDINQAPLSGYQTNQSQISKKQSEAKAAAEASKLKSASSSTSQSSLLSELKNGQLIKGQIIDLRYHEVKLQLEPGKQVITARLSGDIPLSIGQEAGFQVSEDGSGQIVLKYLPNDPLAPADATVMKALTASGLPMTDRNRALVSELLVHRMPVDKATLLNLSRISLANREASPTTLVLMLKNNIPMTSSNIKQFEAYQSGTHQLIRDITSLSQKIADFSMIEEAPLDLQPDQLQFNTSSQASEQSAIATPGFQQALKMNQQLIALLNNGQNPQNEPSDPPLNRILSQQELSLLVKLIEEKGTDTLNQPEKASSDALIPMRDAALSRNEALSLLHNLLPDEVGRSSSSIDSLSDPTIAKVIAKLTDPSAALQGTSMKLSDLLSQDNRLSLMQQLSALPLSEELTKGIVQGDISLKETLNFINQALATADRETVRKLLQAPEYSKLLETAFLEKWTITPEKASQKEEVTNLYHQLKEDLEEISSMLKKENRNDPLPSLLEPVKNLQENLQFMKDLNESFAYLQLPIQLKDKEGHMDLYVLSRKKPVGDQKEAMSVLLHLDMTNLGPLNVHVQLTGHQIEANFYIEDSISASLIKDNLPQLTDAIERKGYHIRADVHKDYKKPDFVSDFIEQNTPDNQVQRYSFDIRT